MSTGRPLWRKMAGDLQFSLQFSHSCTVFPESHSIAILSVLLRHYVRSFANPALIKATNRFMVSFVGSTTPRDSLALPIARWKEFIFWAWNNLGWNPARIHKGPWGWIKAGCMFVMCWYHWSSSLFTVSWWVPSRSSQCLKWNWFKQIWRYLATTQRQHWWPACLFWKCQHWNPAWDVVRSHWFGIDLVGVTF